MSNFQSKNAKLEIGKVDDGPYMYLINKITNSLLMLRMNEKDKSIAVNAQINGAWGSEKLLATKDDLSNFVVERQISADVTIPNGSPYSTSTHDITCDIPSGYKYVGILRAWCIDPSCFVWNAYFRDEGKNAKIDVSNLNGIQKNTKLYISVLYAKS